MRLFDAEGRRLYFTEEERRAFLRAAAQASREVRPFCGSLHATGCRISEALALTAERVALSGRVVVFESLKKRRRGVYRAVPVPPARSPCGETGSRCVPSTPACSARRSRTRRTPSPERPLPCSTVPQRVTRQNTGP